MDDMEMNMPLGFNLGVLLSALGSAVLVPLVSWLALVRRRNVRGFLKQISGDVTPTTNVIIGEFGWVEELLAGVSAFSAGGFWGCALLCATSCARHFADEAGNLSITLGKDSSYDLSYLIWCLGFLIPTFIGMALATHIARSEKKASPGNVISGDFCVSLYMGLFTASRACDLLVINATIYNLTSCWTRSIIVWTQLKNHVQARTTQKVAWSIFASGFPLGILLGLGFGFAQNVTFLAVWDCLMVGFMVYVAIDALGTMTKSISLSTTGVRLDVESDVSRDIERLQAEGHAILERNVVQSPKDDLSSGSSVVSSVFLSAPSHPVGGDSWKIFFIRSGCIVLGLGVCFGMVLLHEKSMGWSSTSSTPMAMRV